MNFFLILTLFCLLSVEQILGQFVPTAGESTLQGSITGGVSNAAPQPTRWIEFMDMDNTWSQLGNTFTVEAWVWHSNSALSSWQPIIARHPGSSAPRQDAHFSIAVQDNSNLEVVAGCGCDANGLNCGYGFSLLATGQSFSTQVWQHVAVTFNGDGKTVNATATLYLDGEMIVSAGWADQYAQCANRASEWATYADVSVGFMDDSNPMDFGWTGYIDEIRFWEEVRTADDIWNYYDIGLMGDEDTLFAYYTFSPPNSVLQDSLAAKQITNEVGDYLHGLPQPDPTNVAIFAQSLALNIGSYSVVEGQSDMTDLPPLPNHVMFSSYPDSNKTIYSVVPGYSPNLQALIDAGLAEIYGNPSDLSTVTVFVTCPNNDCSQYTDDWKSFYFNYTATFDTPTPPTTMYLQIVTECPSGVYDSCGVCEGDNSQCQCIVYHGFETERMSYILFEWSLNNLIADIESGTEILTETLASLDIATPSTAELRQQIYELMTFYNGDLTTYCGDLSSFMTELDTAIPRPPEAFIDDSSMAPNSGAVPFIPAFTPPS